MFRASLRSSALVARAGRQPLAASRGAGSRRLASTSAAAGRHGTWKGAAVRWGLAGGALYWYNTSPIFADEAARAEQAVAATTSLSPPPAPVAVPHDAELLTIDALLEEKEKQKRQAEKEAKKAEAAAAATKTSKTDAAAAETAVAGEGSPAALEEEAGQQGAFNPETGEINWDCPCLGGMAHGPCGEDFKAAFSCFVFSAEEPKGMDCIDKFQHMQDCFRQYPEIYGAELGDDDEGAAGPDAPQHEEQPPAVAGAADGAAAASKPAARPTSNETQTSEEGAAADRAHDATAAPVPASAAQEKAAPPKDPVVQAEVGALAAETAATAAAADDRHLPKAAFDATAANKTAKQ